MADAIPKLTSATDATETRYAPLSWMAVVALTVGVVYVLALLILGITAYLQGKPLVTELLLAIPVGGILLAFAARRSIRNSEGATTGYEYANAGWWLCLIAGLCYGAYWLAIDWSIRSDAERQMKGWTETLMQADPNDPNDPKLKEAFIKTIELERQNSEQVNNPRIFEAEFSAGMNVFRNTNLLLMAARNRDSVRVNPKLGSWNQNDQILECQMSGTLTCAEGEFELMVPMRSTATGSSRRWQITGKPTYLREDDFHRPIGPRTEYGWMVERIQYSAIQKTGEFLLTVMNQQPRQQTLFSALPFPPVGLGQSLALEAYVRQPPTLPTDVPEKALLSALGRFQLTGAAGLLWGTPTDPGNEFFGREDGKPMSADELKVLRSVWDPQAYNPSRLVPAGWRNANDPLRNPVVTVEPDKLTIKVPVEMKPYAGEFLSSPTSFTVGKLVLVCDDPATLKEFNDARAAAVSSGRSLSDRPPEPLIQRQFPLRVIRLESNLPKLTPPARDQGPG